METTGLRLQQLKEGARDRVFWRDVVKIVTRGVCVPMEQGVKSKGIRKKTLIYLFTASRQIQSTASHPRKYIIKTKA